MKNHYTIPFNNLGKQYASIREELLDAQDRVYQTGIALNGLETAKFEAAIAERCGRRFAVTCNSGTQALVFAQEVTRRISYQPDCVLIPDLSYIATLNSVISARNKCYFADVDERGIIDVLSFSRHIDESLNDFGITHIMWVNLFGNMIDYECLVTITELFSDGLVLIEDAAQSFGSKYKGRPSGSFGDVSILSFDPTKNLSNYGSGGCVLTDDQIMYSKLIGIRNNNTSKLSVNFHAPHVGAPTNSKMSEADCAAMLVKLGHFDRWQKRRKDIADYYSQELGERVEVITGDADTESNWHKFVIRFKNFETRQRALRTFTEANIETKIHYEYSLSEFGHLCLNPHVTNHSSNTLRFKNCALSLPIYPELSDYEIEQVVITLRSCNL